jgi:hypothetical protein
MRREDFRKQNQRHAVSVNLISLGDDLPEVVVLLAESDHLSIGRGRIKGLGVSAPSLQCLLDKIVGGFGYTNPCNG